MKQTFSFLFTVLLTCSAAAQNFCIPSITAYNGFALSLLPTDTDGDGMTDAARATVSVNDLVRFTSNLCNGPLTLRIRKAGTGTGAPTDTEVTFGCNELGTQLVEVWGGDAAGSWSYVNTYVLVGDVSGVCIGVEPPHSTDCANDEVAPELVLHNGLAASFLPTEDGTGTVKITAAKLVKRKTDNCDGPIKLRIRSAGTGAGVPATSSVTFTCADDKVQLLEVWAGDASDNWTYAETYVLVSDDNDVCGNPIPAGCDPDMTPPSVLVHNGLVVNIGIGTVGAKALVCAQPFLQQRKDNCDIGNLDIRIGKDDGSTTPPLTLYTYFTCNELGTQPVVIWVGDASGNWSRTKTYVLVEDNEGICGIAPKVSFPDWKTALLSAPARDRNAEPVSVAQQDFSVYPNPTSSAFTLRCQLEKAGGARFELYNAVGQKVKNLRENTWLPAGETRLDFDTDGLPVGLYWCAVQIDGTTKTVAVMKN